MHSLSSFNDIFSLGLFLTYDETDKPIFIKGECSVIKWLLALSLSNKIALQLMNLQGMVQDKSLLFF
jgi:hypothetical protein